MKRTILAFVAAAACSVEAAVMYRGRLVDAEFPDASQLTFSGSKKMTFRIYDDSGRQLGDPLVREVPLETNGTFTVLLDSTELAEALREGKATQVGLTVGDAANEIRPLRKLLPTARAVQADAATGLSRGAKVGKMSAAGFVETEKLAVGGNLTVGGGIKPAVEGAQFDRVSYKVRLNEGSKLWMTNGAGKALGEAKLLTPDLAAGCAGVAAGETIKDPDGKAIVAPADGVATICCVETLKIGSFTPYSPCCSVVQFYRKGEEIKVPDGWSWQPVDGGNEKKRFTVRFHPFVDVKH